VKPVAGLLAAAVAVALTTALLHAAGVMAPVAEDRLEAQRTHAAQAALRASTPPLARRRTRAIPVARPVARGQALATMTIPRFGQRWRWEVAEGVALDVIDGGPGHFPGTALPGARGNTAYAAHRAGHGDPFIDFDQLRPGDRITLAQRDTAWTYRVTMRPRIIDIDDVWVLDHLSGRRLTLTTCWPRYGSSRRMYVRADLARVESRRDAGWTTTWSSASSG
jgi:sortase A